MTGSLRIALAALPFLALAACAPDDSSGSTTGDGPDDPKPTTCAAPTHGPTIHRGDVMGDETWSADASPHVVEETVNVRNGARLVIEPCATVEMAEGKSLHVAFPITPNTGTLIAEGSEHAPIHFRGQDGARWGRVLVQSPGTASLAWVTFEDGGGADSPSGATLVAEGDGALPIRRDLAVDHVTIDGSLGAGVKVLRRAAFAKGSDALVVRGSGSPEHPYPIEIGEAAIDGLPLGDYTSNAKDEILIAPEFSVEEDAEMRDVGVPYHLGDSPVDRLVVGHGRQGDPPATLTIEAGTTIRFDRETGFEIEHATGTFAATGALVAVGTAASPIVFESGADAPAPGDWKGLWFGGVPAATDRIEHARIAHTGADCGCILVSCCGNLEGYEGAVIFTQPPASPFVRDTEIAYAASNAFVLGYDGVSMDFTESNTFTAVAGLHLVTPRDGSCPNPLPTCE
ncbi:MAG TPA: hypothetical protein VL400_14395 [Polyangiaceae bacterium]|nr:hypothetical protein [Polyangiaceae bacterium]